MSVLIQIFQQNNDEGKIFCFLLLDSVKKESKFNIDSRYWMRIQCAK